MRKPNELFKGFSMVELLMVVFIIVVTGGIAIPAGINFVRTYQATTAAQSVASSMQHARSQAVRRNSTSGMILNFDYPQPGQLQFTSLDLNPRTGQTSDCFPGTGAGRVPAPSATNFGIAPNPPNSVTPCAQDGASPHGPVFTLPPGYQFRDGQGASSLLFRSNGSVMAVTAQNVSGADVTQVGQNFQVVIENPSFGLVRTIVITPGGRVTINRDLE